MLGLFLIIVDPKVLALLLLMFDTVFLTFQFRQKSATNLDEDIFSLHPKPTILVAGVHLEDINLPFLVTPIPCFSSKNVSESPLTQTSSNVQNTSSIDINNFLYPDAKINIKNSFTAYLQTDDSTNTITNWYKGKLNSLGLVSSSLITTQTIGWI